jgi:hypothetical protein
VEIEESEVKRMDRFQSIDTKIHEGYTRIRKKDNLGGCDIWLEAWDEIMVLVAEGAVKDISDLEEKYDWTEFLSNYIQDIEFELHNAGQKDKSYHKKCAAYCEGLIQLCGEDEKLVRDVRRGMAEAYFSSGDVAKCEKLYTDWLSDDPDWGWGYVGWSDNYWFGIENDQYERAIEILLMGYARSTLRDKIAVVDRLGALYKEVGKPEKAAEYEKMFSVMQRTVSRDSPYYDPRVKAKIGRNESCPCGSGKEYKKCCGA